MVLPGRAEQSGPIVPTLERVLARDPNHPGAIHYYIHAVEASDRPERAEPCADRLRGAIPGAGHLVHMPSHIYYRVGRYVDALAAAHAPAVAALIHPPRLRSTTVDSTSSMPTNLHSLAGRRLPFASDTLTAATTRLSQAAVSERSLGT